MPMRLMPMVATAHAVEQGEGLAVGEKCLDVRERPLDIVSIIERDQADLAAVHAAFRIHGVEAGARALVHRLPEIARSIPSSTLA